MGERGEYWKSASDGKWYYHRVAGNGEVTDPSQGYTNASNARRAAREDLGLEIPLVEVDTPVE